MKKLNLLILFSSFTSVVFCQPATLSGNVTYHNAANTPIIDSCVVNLSIGTTISYSVPVNITGSYSFTNVTPGTYTLTAVCTKKPGGLNSVDALMILKNFVGIPPLLTGIALIAADVNCTGGTPNAADAIAVQRAFLMGVIDFSYPNCIPGGPPWRSESFTLVLGPGQVATQNIQILVAGDVNGSFTPFP